MRQRIDCLLVASGKGGVGTSVITSLLAIAAAERGDKVLLVDATESGGTLHHLFGVRPTQSLWSLADSRSRSHDVIVEVDDRLSFVAGGTSGNGVAPATDHERRAALARLAHVYAEYETIIFDGGSRLDTVSAVSELADPRLLLVTSADRLALAANYALVKSITSRRDDAPISVVANRHGEALAGEACEFLVGACSHFLNRTIDVVGAVPDDPCLQAAVGAGLPVRDALEGSPAADAVRGVLALVVPSQRATLPRANASSNASAAAFAGSSLSTRRWS